MKALVLNPKEMRRVAAFTLIELTISAAVASIILVASYLCLSAGVASQKLIEPRTQALQGARVALAMMSADLRSACTLSTNFDFLGTERNLEGMTFGNLDFATHHYFPKRPTEGDYCQVSYYVDKSRGSEHYSLWRRRNPHLAPNPLEDGSHEEILPGLRGFTLQFFDGAGDTYPTWGEDVKQKVKFTTLVASNLVGFPEAVKITLQVDPNPGQSASKPEPPLMFQTVVRLELADVPAQNAGAGAADNSSQDNGDNGGQNPGGGN